MTNLNLQTARLVGRADEKNWSQVHVFAPDDSQKKVKYGTLLASLSLKSGSQNALNWGKELLQRIHEAYFSCQKTTPFECLKDLVEKIDKELEKSELVNVVLGVVWQKDSNSWLYLTKLGQGQVWVKRAQKMMPVSLDSKEVVSGRIKSSDMVMLATQSLVDLVGANRLKTGMLETSPQKVVEVLAPFIQGSGESGQAALVCFSLNQSPPLDKKDKQAKVTLKNRFQAAGQVFKQNFERLKKRSQPPLKIKSGDKQSSTGSKSKKKTGISVGLILLLLLVLTVFLGGKKRQEKQVGMQINPVLKKVEAKLTEGQSLSSINPLRSKVILNEALSLLDQEMSRFDQDSSQYQRLKTKKGQVSDVLGQISRSFEDEGEVWFDLGLVKPDFKGESWDWGEEGLLIFDPSQQTLVKVNHKNKSADILAGGEEVSGYQQVAYTLEHAYLVGSSQILQVNQERQTVQVVKSDQDWAQVEAVTGFSNNVYLLDQNQILKFPAVNRGIGDARNYLNEGIKLEGGIDLAIDGSVWVLQNNGVVSKYIRGQKDAFRLMGLNQPLKKPTKIFTSETHNNLYILDPQATKVVVVDKAGEFRAEYVWPGLAGGLDIFADEEQGLILVLTGEKIFSLEIK